MTEDRSSSEAQPSSPGQSHPSSDAGAEATAPAGEGVGAQETAPSAPADSLADSPVDTVAGDADGSPDAGEAPGNLENLLADVASAQSRVAALTDDLQRLQAEYVNYKRRVDRDRELVLQNATLSVLSALLPVLDDLDRAREHGELEGGFKAVADALEQVVGHQGLTKFGAAGDEFDPRLHEALMHAQSAEVTTTTCRDLVSAGYRIGDRVVRPAKVTVVGPAGDES